MHTQESIYEHLTSVLEELFEIDPETIKPSALLYEDLDIDSIDAVDLVVKMKELTGKKIQPTDFRDVRTVQDLVDVMLAVVNAEPAEELSA